MRLTLHPICRILYHNQSGEHMNTPELSPDFFVMPSGKLTVVYQEILYFVKGLVVLKDATGEELHWYVTEVGEKI